MTEINIRKYRGTDLCSTIASSSLVKASVQPLRLLFTSDTLSVRSYTSPTNYKERLEDVNYFQSFLCSKRVCLMEKGIAEFIVPDGNKKIHFSQFSLLSIVKGFAQLISVFTSIYLCFDLCVCIRLWKVERKVRNREIKKQYGGDFLGIEECYK